MDLTIISTYRCNSKCQMCYIWKNPTDQKEEVSLETLSKLPGGFDNLERLRWRAHAAPRPG